MPEEHFEEPGRYYLKYFSAEYERERNLLIPVAEKYANTYAGTKPSLVTEENKITLETYNAKWNLSFHTEMNILWEFRLDGKALQQERAKFRIAVETCICPRCGSEKGEICRTPSGRACQAHEERVNLLN